MTRVYLDTCSLNRPWDDQRQIRIHLEAEAVLCLIDSAERGEIELVSSDYLFFELSKGADAEKMEKASGLLNAATIHVEASNAIAKRAVKFRPSGITGSDALHVAAAEIGAVNWFVSTDDRLLKRGARACSITPVKFINPVDWPPI